MLPRNALSHIVLLWVRTRSNVLVHIVVVDALKTVHYKALKNTLSLIVTLRLRALLYKLQLALKL